MNKSDQELILNYFGGDPNSLEILIRRYLKPIYVFAYRYAGNAQDAEDIAQEAFVKAWKNLKRYDREKSFKTWIFVIAKNTAIDFLKKKRSSVFSDFENNAGENMLMETLRDLSPLPDALSKNKSFSQMLWRMIDGLAPKYRLVLSMRYQDDFTFNEIAEFIGAPLNTVKSMHFRAINALRKIIREL